MNKTSNETYNVVYCKNANWYVVLGWKPINDYNFHARKAVHLEFFVVVQQVNSNKEMAGYHVIMPTLLYLYRFNSTQGDFLFLN